MLKRILFVVASATFLLAPAPLRAQASAEKAGQAQEKEQVLWQKLEAAIAGIGAVTVFREHAKLQAGQVSGPGRLILAICFTLSFAWFGLSSFWRVRRRRKA